MENFQLSLLLSLTSKRLEYCIRAAILKVTKYFDNSSAHNMLMLMILLSDD